MPEYRQTELELSNEDNLRLNILLCQDVNAIRINESQLILFALIGEADSADKEVSIKLSPNCNSDKYVKSVKAFLASHYLDSPAGFPIFMNRWTRTGELKNEKAGEFLKIAEPEAVVAITYGESISVKHAKYAWWANSSVENARQLLTHDNVAESDLSRELADFLLEFLPFEIEAKDIVLTVKLLLQRNLMDENNKQKLWKKGQRKTAYLIGFLSTGAHHIPGDCESHPILGVCGNAYITACINALDGFSDQDSVVLLFDAINSYFQLFADNEDILAFSPVLKALSKINQDDLMSVLAHSNAVGSLLRRKLKHVTDPVKDNLHILAGTS